MYFQVDTNKQILFTNVVQISTFKTLEYPGANNFLKAQ